MNIYDESLAILRGQIDTHKQKIEIYTRETELHMKSIKMLEGQIDSFNNRIYNLNIVIKDLSVLKENTTE